MNDLTPEQREIWRRAIPNIRQYNGKERYSTLRKLKDLLGTTFGVGNYITPAKIEGGVGERLDVTLGGIKLSDSDYLPLGVKFIGCAVGSQQHGVIQNEHPSAAYSSKEFAIYVPVSSKPGAKSVPLTQLRVNGLVLLHEMGHAWHHYKNSGEYMTFTRKIKEAAAWKIAWEIKTRLEKQNPKIRLWDGSEESLMAFAGYFFIRHQGISLNDLNDANIRRAVSSFAFDPKYS